MKTRNNQGAKKKRKKEKKEKKDKEQSFFTF